MSELRLGKYLGRGAERFCYENLDNPDTCLKVSKKTSWKQTRRELSYVRFLKFRGIHPSFMPKFYGLHETEDSYILEQEYFHDTEEFKVLTVHNYVLSATDEGLKVLEKLLNDVKDEMIRFNIIVCDLRTINFMVLISRKTDLPVRIVVFDGYGSPEFIPLPNWIPCLGKRKIERQWKKLMMRYEADKQERDMKRGAMQPSP